MSEQYDNQHAADAFSEQWLSLREPADHAARSQQLIAPLISWANSQSRLSITDLGAGTGSNLRYLCPLLGHKQHWTLIDQDQQLLKELPRLLHHWAQQHDVNIKQTGDTLTLASDTFTAQVQRQQLNLATHLDKISWNDTNLITGSALLDLTAVAWISALSQYCADNQCTALFALNYNGFIQWRNPLGSDSQMRRLLNAHQRRDKGFGHASGPQASARFEQHIRASHRVSTDNSHWCLSQDEATLQQALIDGWVQAAQEQAPDEHDLINQWHAERTHLIRNSESSLTVGHTDILAFAR